MTDIVPFSIAAELPRGRLAIEASAGTGKTYALAGLAARYVVEAEVPIGELLVVTFTRAAAAELRDRVRARLVDAADALASNIDPDDEVLAVLCDVPDDERARRLLLAQRAVSDFDSATITTIHGFAQQVLGSLGTSVPTDPDAVLVDDTPALIAQVATDLLTAEAVSCRHPAEDLPKHPKLVAAARLALGNPAAQLVPDADDPDLGGDAALRRRLVDTIADEVDRRRRASSSLSFDDLLVRLRAALDDPDRGAAARHALRRRYRIALIDEFQDTDPVQWAIFDAVFGARDADSHDGGPTPTLVLVGDPKQAIYAFRGADVHTYLDAAHAPGTDLCGLTTNWRSDAAYLTALELLLEGTTFGDDRIAFHHVDHAERNAATRIVDGNGDSLPTLALRLAAGDIDRHSRRPKIVLTEAARDAVHHDLAVYIRDLLEDAWLPGRTDDDRPRPLQPDDIAVLVATGAEGPEVRAALERVGVPAVMARGDNVLTSAAATQWHLLLSALARPADVRRARAVAVSWFVGWTGDELAAADDDAIADLHATLHRWADVLAGQGLATLLGTLRAETGVAARVLARSDGDRAMTDLDHVAELLQLAAPRRVSPAMLLATFEQLAGGDDEGDPEADLAARRVESESRAVQIMTTHVAKGLEFEVVCCPSLSHATPVKKAFVDPVRWDPDGHRRIVDVAGDVTWPDADTKADRTEQALAEAIGSNLRVLYVALTRARHHTAVWWAPTDGAAATGLARVLFARDADGRIDPATFTGTGAVATPDGEDAVAALAPLVDRSDGRIAATLVHRPARRPRRWAGGAAPTTAELQAATLGRRLDRRAGRWSFTAITARAHEDHDVGIDPLDDTVGDAADADELIPPDERPDGLPTGVASAHDRTSVAETPAAAGPDAAPDGLPSDGPAQLALSFDADTGSDVGDTDTDADADATPPDGDRVVPLGDIAGGAGFGTLVHEVLERVDLTADDLATVLGEAVDERLAWNPWAVEVEHLVEGLVAVATTPLGPAFDGRRLVDLAPADRLDELSFDLTLGDSGERATDRAIGSLLLEHLAEDDPLRPWAAHLADGPFDATLAGHLTGSIDLVARVRADGSPGGSDNGAGDGTSSGAAVSADRFVVVDYKTNRIAAPGEPAKLGLFRPDRLTAAMVAHHYPLQALLYEVALHRYLRWRLRGYDPAVHLGGIAYLFVRGMVGPDTPHVDGGPHGVWTWTPPVSLIEALSALLDGTGPATGQSTDAEVDVTPPTPLLAEATAHLEPFVVAGVVDTAGVHLAATLARLVPGTPDEVLLAAAVTVQALQLGHVCVELDRAHDVGVDPDRDPATLPDDADPLPAVAWPDPDAWVTILADADAVAVHDPTTGAPLGPDTAPDRLRPLVLAGRRLYLERYWRYERTVGDALLARGTPTDGDGPADAVVDAALDATFGPAPADGDAQRQAARVALRSRLAVLAGGPGTGKTYTVARFLAAVHHVAQAEGRPVQVALVAPTGKAAARLSEAVHAAVAEAGLPDAVVEPVLGTEAGTIHRLLGYAGGIRFRYDRDDPLPHDVVVVDETSMVALPLMARLLDALRPNAQVVLVGDPYQLASVEAGAVLGDVVGDEPRRGPLAGQVVVLDRVHRFAADSTIAAFADAVRLGDADAAEALLAADHDDLRWIHPDDTVALDALRADVEADARAVVEAAMAGDAEAGLALAGARKVLCATRFGPLGSFAWRDRIERSLEQRLPGLIPGTRWYVGRPVIVTRNDYLTGVFNGDTGLVVDIDGRPSVALPTGTGVRHLAPAQLANVDTWWAMTIHKSQGSEFDHAVVALPSVDSPILTRELLYTAVTRGRHRVSVVATAEALRHAIAHPVARASGLGARLWPGS